MQEMTMQEIRRACPFVINDKVVFPFRPLRDIAFIWPQPKPITHGTLGLIEIPDQFRGDYRQGVGVLLAAGPGWYGRDARRRVNGLSGYWVDPGPKQYFHPTSDQLQPGVLVQYNIQVPWYEFAKDQQGKKHFVVMLGVSDIFGVYEE
jgi:hypothetical protein